MICPNEIITEPSLLAPHSGIARTFRTFMIIVRIVMGILRLHPELEDPKGMRYILEYGISGHERNDIFDNSL